MTNEPKHTPGPWIAIQKEHTGLNDDYWFIEAGVHQDFDERTRTGFSFTGFASEKDAALIASSPELLHALELMLELFADGENREKLHVVKTARAAIAKAKGAA